MGSQIISKIEKTTKVISEFFEKDINKDVVFYFEKNK